MQKLLFQNPYMRVYELRVPPGAFEAKHSHLRGLTVALSEYDNETTSFPGRKTVKRHTDLGEVRWAEPVTHEARNTGTTEQRAIRVELLQGPGVANLEASTSKELDPLVVCKDTQKVVLDNEYVRVTTEHLPPGAAQPRHQHGRGVLITLAGTTIESVVYPSGARGQRTLIAGEVGWREPVIHEVKNVGTTELSTIRIELK
jgi:predicted metal-dependent enzyme (double-stranded beta helix superfamily)